MARRDTAARRYAEAAFEIGKADGTLETWERDLVTLRDGCFVVAGGDRVVADRHPGHLWVSVVKHLEPGTHKTFACLLG